MVYYSLDLVYKADPPNQVLTSSIVNRIVHRTVLELIKVSTEYLQRIESDKKRHKALTRGCIGLYNEDTMEPPKR